MTSGAAPVTGLAEQAHLLGRGPTPVRRSTAAGGLSAARARVLELVQHQGGEVSVDELAQQLGQHPNTVREHLDALGDAGLLLRRRRPGPGRGRPAWGYRPNPARPEPDARVREHGAVVDALAAHLAAHSSDPRAEAREAGMRWGRALIDPPDSGPAVHPDPGPERHPHDGAVLSQDGPAPVAPAVSALEARDRVVALLADLDFGPRPDRSATQVILTTCPLLDVARRHPDVVCALHEGMVAGALECLQAPSEGVSLVPFGDPQGCVLTLPRTPAAQRARGASA